VATESEANFISVKGPEIFSKWVGESEKAIREIFRKARMAAPCVIFLDEIDAIAPKRGYGYGDSGVTDRVVSQLLTEMDGLVSLEDVVVLAATNKPHLIDDALLRPGRFDRLIYIPPPDYATRLEILRVHTKGMPLAKSVSLESLAKRTERYSGADLAALCREAAMNAMRRDAEEVSMEDFEEALKAVKPSLREDLLRLYEEFTSQLK
ncbi:MAG: hypothetical protein DRJ97_00725, partial [Thermoprotei archaeon]